MGLVWYAWVKDDRIVIFDWTIALSNAEFCHKLCLHHQPISSSNFQFYLKQLQVAIVDL